MAQEFKFIDHFDYAATSFPMYTKIEIVRIDKKEPEIVEGYFKGISAYGYDKRYLVYVEEDGKPPHVLSYREADFFKLLRKVIKPAAYDELGLEKIVPKDWCIEKLLLGWPLFIVAMIILVFFKGGIFLVIPCFIAFLI